MAEWGGLGGAPQGRPFNQDDAFEVAVERALGERLRKSPELRVEMWSALANVEWKHDNGDTAMWSFRAAGDLIAAISGVGNYMDYYCSGPYARVSKDVADGMATQGWKPITDGEYPVEVDA